MPELRTVETAGPSGARTRWVAVSDTSAPDVVYVAAVLSPDKAQDHATAHTPYRCPVSGGVLATGVDPFTGYTRITWSPGSGEGWEVSAPSGRLRVRAVRRPR